MGALCLLHDLLLLQEVGSVPVVVNDRALKERAFARWATGGEPLDVPWFSDIWSTFWEMSLFVDIWNQVKRQARVFASDVGWMTLQDIAMYLRCGWALAGLWVLSRDEGGRHVQELRSRYFQRTLDDPGEKTHNQGQEKAIFGLLKEHFIPAIQDLAASVNARFEDRKDDRVTNERIAWLVALGTMFTPECGCLVDTSVAPGDASEGGWTRIVRQVQEIVYMGKLRPDKERSARRPEITWNTRITSQVVEKRVRRLFSKRPWNPTALWFLAPVLAAGLVESPLGDRRVFSAQPANDEFAGEIQRVIKLACLNASGDRSADDIRRRLEDQRTDREDSEG